MFSFHCRLEERSWGEVVISKLESEEGNLVEVGNVEDFH